MWGQNGVTFSRHDIDQAAIVPAWGSTQARVPFQSLKQAGFLRRLLLQSPRTQYGLTVTTADYLAAASTEQDFPTLRSIASLALTLQRVAPIYSLNRGIDLAYLMHVGAGRTFRNNQSLLGNISTQTQTNTAVFGKKSAAWDYIGGIVSVTAGSGTAQNVQFGLDAELPLTEMIKFPAGIAVDSTGKAVAIPETHGEVGLITLQNSQQNLVPSVILNPFYTLATGPNQVYLGTAVLPSTTVAPVFNLYSEFYDVPENPQDWPPGYSFDYIIQYQSFDDAISGGKVTHKFDNAGQLMRAVYVFLNATDNVVDCSSLAVDGNIAFKWGSSVQHRNNSFQVNLTDAGERYGTPPLFGALYHDFFTDEQSTRDMINTAKITSPRCEITGAPGTATTLHTIEQRLIPVMIRQG